MACKLLVHIHFMGQRTYIWRFIFRLQIPRVLSFHFVLLIKILFYFSFVLLIKLLLSVNHICAPYLFIFLFNMEEGKNGPFSKA
jgi:hypothetical protein